MYKLQDIITIRDCTTGLEILEPARIQNYIKFCVLANHYSILKKAIVMAGNT